MIDLGTHFLIEQIADLLKKNGTSFSHKVENMLMTKDYPAR